MEVNLQIFNDGDQITISEPTEDNFLVLRVGLASDEELTEYLLTYEMVEKIRSWLNEQSRKMAINSILPSFPSTDHKIKD